MADKSIVRRMASLDVADMMMDDGEVKDKDRKDKSNYFHRC